MSLGFVKKILLSSFVILSACLGTRSVAQMACTNDLAGRWEADIYPESQPGFQGGDGQVKFLDFAIIGQYAAALKTPFGPCDAMIADCAPRSSLGNGTITTIDVVQAFRYATAQDPYQLP